MMDRGPSWGTRWTVPGWEEPAPASDLARWRLDGRDGPPAPAGPEGRSQQSWDPSEELDGLSSDGITALRVTLEWARLEPADGRIDAAAVEHLRAALTGAHDRGFELWGTLHDGPLPGWFSHDERGFSDERTRRYHWARHVETTAESVGDLIDGWIPVVEPTRWAKRAWLDGTRPPGGHDDGGGFVRNLEGIHLASVEAAHRLAESGRPVASGQWMVPVFPARDDPRLPSSAEAEVAAAEVEEVLWRSWVRMLAEETLVLPGRSPVPVPGARQAFDVIGVTYRHAISVAADRTWSPHPGGLATGADGQVPWSEGLALCLHRAADAMTDRDLMVVDVGVGLSEVEARTRYLSEIHGVIDEAVDGGIPLRACFVPGAELP